MTGVHVLSGERQTTVGQHDTAVQVVPADGYDDVSIPNADVILTER